MLTEEGLRYVTEEVEKDKNMLLLEYYKGFRITVEERISNGEGVLVVRLDEDIIDVGSNKALSFCFVSGLMNGLRYYVKQDKEVE
jgi:predicted ATP-grasp superfamily ATP-dependent carboligase